MSPRSAVLARGRRRRPRANTADLGPITGPIRNYLTNDKFELLIETCLPCLYWFEMKQDMTSSLLADRIGRVASVMAE